METNVFYLGDCLDVMRYDIPAESIDLIYLDPPFFGTGVQEGGNKTYLTYWGKNIGNKFFDHLKRRYNIEFRKEPKIEESDSEISIKGDHNVLLKLDRETRRVELQINNTCVEILKVYKKNGRLTIHTWDPGVIQISYDDSKKFWSEKNIRENAPLWLQGLAMKKPDSHWKPLARYLYYMMERLEACKRVLKSTGSIYLHCDWRASHYLKMIMDEIFGYENFQNEIVWHYRRSSSISRFTHAHDIIFFYSKTRKKIFNPSEIKVYYKEIYGESFKPGLGDRKSGKDKNGYYKYIYLDDVWDIKGVFNLSKEFIGYPTQKPEALLERIIKASSNEGDIVLDPFCGCGTTIVVAHKLNRRWVGIDINEKAMQIIKSRLNEMGLTQSKLDFKIEYPSFKISRETLLKMTGKQFERWVNRICNATKPSYDGGVDGIMEDGTPIQTKTYKVRYDIVGKLLNDAEAHSEVPKPLKKIRVVSRKGFDESAWERKAWIERNKGIKVELLTPEDLLK